MTNKPGFNESPLDNTHKDAKKVGWKFPLYATAILLGVVACLLSYYQHNKKSLVSSEHSVTENEKLLTKQQLRHCDGSRDCLYLAVLGRVYDVKKGERFYGVGQGYHGFTGRDATRAFVTGDFSQSGLTDDITDFTDGQLLTVHNWLEFYEKSYLYVGKLVGKYYNDKGIPTKVLVDVEAKIKEGLRRKELDKEDRLLYPPCNSEWRLNEGTKVWCSKDSGGVQREWTGVPRQRFTPGKDSPQCVCVQVDSQEGHDDASLRMYPDCAKTDVVCRISND